MRKKVLITDDDLGLQDAFKIIFERAGYEVNVSDDAQCLFDGSCGYPDVIVLDWHLSGIDGLDVCRFLKSKEATQRIPVVMVSATPGINLKAKEAGADDFIEKPFVVKKLLAVVDHWAHIS